MQHDGPVHFIAFSPDGRLLLTSSADHTARMWLVASARPVGRPLRHQGIVRFATFSPDGQQVVTASDDRTAQLWSTPQPVKGKPGEVISWIESITGMDLDERGAATPLDVATWQERRRAASDAIAINVAVSADAVRAADQSAQEQVKHDAKDRPDSKDHENVHEVLRAGLLREIAHVSKQLEANPRNIRLIRLRVDLLACAGRFDEAIAALQDVMARTPNDHLAHYKLLPLLAEAGRKEDYRNACETMATLFAEAEHPEIHERVAKGSLFWAESGVDAKRVVSIAERGLKIAMERRHVLLPCFQTTKGLAEYRLGNYSAALQLAEQALAPDQDAYYIVVPGYQLKAMALARLGRLNESKQALDKARLAHEQAPKPIERALAFWNDWYMADIMFREADALLMAKPLTETR
jgi:tetratricopeptide (TPR) repeat protein